MLAQIFPAALVMNAFKEVDILLSKLRSDHGVAVGDRLEPYGFFLRRMLRDAPNRDLVLTLYSQLQRTRNRAVHEESTITSAEALAFQGLCEQLIENIKAAIPSATADTKRE